MRSIENKTTRISINDGKVLTIATYADLMRMVINQGKQGGFDYADMEQRMAISKALNVLKDALEDAPKIIELEEANYKYFKSLVAEMKWSFWHEDLLKFKDDIFDAK